MSSPEALGGKVALVTGASRGVGACVARGLAQGGADVILSFRSKARRAEEVAAQVRSLGRRALLAPADITIEAEVESLLQVAREAGRLDLLILNASGGLEKGKPAGYAMELNLTAQERLAGRALPLMPRGGRIVFVTSHAAHFHGQQPVHPVYEPVAASKRAGELALRARLPELAARGLSLVVVSGGAIRGTITPRLMERMSRGCEGAPRPPSQPRLSAEEFAAAIVRAAADESLPSGAVVLVGGVPGNLGGASVRGT